MSEEPRAFVMSAQVDGQRMITERGETVLSTIALLSYITNELTERVHMPCDEIRISVWRDEKRAS